MGKSAIFKQGKKAEITKVKNKGKNNERKK